MDYVTQKYVNLLSSRVRNFKRRGQTAVFSCPLCGDSKTDPRKARGYVYEKKGETWYHCHNECGGMLFTTLLKRLDPRLSTEMWLETNGHDRRVNPVVDEPSERRVVNSPLEGLRVLRSVDESHVARRYLARRMVPDEWLDRLLLADDFRRVANRLDPERHRKEGPTEPRLMIPSWSPDGKWIVNFQCRSLADDPGLRYVGIVVDERFPQVFNLERLDRRRRAYALEGPIDSMFLENSVAVLGGTIMSKLHEVDHEDVVVVYDNEPRNRSTIRNMERVIDAGRPLCVWPKGLPEKDVNEMILGGLSIDRIKSIIDENTYEDRLSARVALNTWRMT